MNRQLRIASLMTAGLGLAATSAVLLAADRQAEIQRVDRSEAPAATEGGLIGSTPNETTFSAAPTIRVAITDDTGPPNDNKTNDKINETAGGTVHLRLAYNVTSPGYVNTGVPQESPATGGGYTFNTVGGPGGSLDWPEKIPSGYGDFFHPESYRDFLAHHEYDKTEAFLTGHDRYWQYYNDDEDDFTYVHIHIDELHPENSYRYREHWNYNDGSYDEKTEENYKAADEPTNLQAGPGSPYWGMHVDLFGWGGNSQPYGPFAKDNPFGFGTDQSWITGGRLDSGVLGGQQVPNVVDILRQPWNSSALIDPGIFGVQQTPGVIGSLRIDQAWGQPQISGELHMGTFGQGIGSGSIYLQYQFGTATGQNLVLPWMPNPFFGLDTPPSMSLDTDKPASSGLFGWQIGGGLEGTFRPPPMTLDTDTLQLPDVGGFQPNSFNQGGVQFNIQTFGPGYGLPAFNSPGVFVRPFPPMPDSLPGSGAHNDIGFNESPHQAYINGLYGTGGFQIPASELGTYNFSGTQLTYDLKLQVSNYTSFVWRVADNYPAIDELNSQLQLPPTAQAGYQWGTAGLSKFVRTTVQDSSWNPSFDWRRYIKDSYATTAIYDTPFTKQPAPNPDGAGTYPARRELPEAAIRLASEPQAAK
jgi:hypothetical protein